MNDLFNNTAITIIHNNDKIVSVCTLLTTKAPYKFNMILVNKNRPFIQFMSLM